MEQCGRIERLTTHKVALAERTTAVQTSVLAADLAEADGLTLRKDLNEELLWHGVRLGGGEDPTVCVGCPSAPHPPPTFCTYPRTWLAHARVRNGRVHATLLTPLPCYLCSLCCRVSCKAIWRSAGQGSVRGRTSEKGFTWPRTLARRTNMLGWLRYACVGLHPRRRACPPLRSHL